MKMFALIDANSFYASCEKIFRPDLWGKPVVVCSNNDGCVVARSAEAKKLGIKMGEPLFKIERFLRENGVTVFSSNYALYGDMSRRMMTIIGEMVPGQEIYSIDECFADVSGISNRIPLVDFGHQIRNRILKETFLTVGVGYGPSKTLAKLANHAAKTWTKTDGVVDLSDRSRQRALMKILPVSEVWGIGRRLSKRLEVMGIKTALDLADANTTMIRRNFGVVVERTQRELNGVSCIPMEEAPPPKQQIVTSKSFGQRVETLEDMQKAVCTYAVRASEKLREQGSRCRHISVFIATSRFSNEPQYANSAAAHCEHPTSDTRDIVAFAMKALDRIWKDGYRYARAGIMLGDFYSSGIAQLDMFSEHLPRPNSEALMRVIDNINKSGKGSVWFAGQGVDNAWTMKRGMLSPAYTTRLSDVPVVR